MNSNKFQLGLLYNFSELKSPDYKSITIVGQTVSCENERVFAKDMTKAIKNAEQLQKRDIDFSEVVKHILLHNKEKISEFELFLEETAEKRQDQVAA